VSTRYSAAARRNATGLRSGETLVNYHAEEQYWGQPYDKRYLVLTFPDFDFKMMDLLALSKSAVVGENDSMILLTLSSRNDSMMEPG